MNDVKTKQQAIAEVESALVRQVRLNESISRVDLARQSGLAPSTIGLYVDRLIEEGFLREGRKARRPAGRPPTILELNAEAGEFIGVDFDARQMAVSRVDFSQRILQQHQRPLLTSEDAEQVVAKIEETIAEVAGESPLLGIGLAVPGTVDTSRGVALHYEYIRGWREVRLVERLSRRFRVPLYLENNIRAMAFAEQWFGEARGVDNFVCLGIRSGIGAGVIVDGELRRGQDGLAGEIGGWPCPSPAGPDPDFERQTPGEEDLTLEQVASVRAILTRLADEVRAGASTSLVLTRDEVVLEEMLRGVADSDPLVLHVIERAARAVGRVIVQLSLLLNPRMVIIAGPLAELAEAFLHPLSETVERLSPPLHAKPPQIVASEFGAFGGALGAAALAVHEWKPERPPSFQSLSRGTKP